MPGDMVFANNAVYCPGSTAIDASGIGNAILNSNYITGNLRGVAIDDLRLYEGGIISSAFAGPDKKNYWP